MARIYALLVGINKYAAVPPLGGCVGDIQAVEALLRKRVAPDALALHVLHDEAATRDAIISGFRTHLTQARAGDVAAFYFCGHGSQEACPPEWLALEPSGKNQTIVPVDSRVGDVFDIADKELSALIHEVAAGGAHVLTLFDSCHSGGVTRDVDDGLDDGDGVSRTAPATKGRARTLADYIESARTLYDPAKIATDGPPAPSHIAIAACQATQTAKEFPRQAPRRGAFTQAFEEAVNTLGPAATYLDLVTAIRLRVRDRATDQLPNLSVSGAASGSAIFLDGHAGRRDLSVNADAAGTWWLSAGAIDGIPSPDAGQLTEVAVYARDVFARDGVSAAAIARGLLDQVTADRARLRFSEGAAALETTQIYTGVITKLAAIPLHVMVTGDDIDGVTKVRAHLDARDTTFALADAKSGKVPTVTVRVMPDGISILGTDDVPLQNLHFTTSDPDLGALAAAMAHLARWYATRDFTPLGSSLNDVVAIELVPATPSEIGIPVDRPAHVVTNGTLALQYSEVGPPRVQFRLRNTASERLYVTLLDISDSFACGALFSDWIPAGAIAFARSGRALQLAIPEWRDPGFRVGTECLKVIVTREQVDVADRFEIPSLLSPKSTGGTREVLEESDDASFWGTTMVTVTIQR